MKLHVTLVHPIRLMLSGRSSAIVAFDGEVFALVGGIAVDVLSNDDEHTLNVVKFVTSAVYPSGGKDGSPQPVKIRTTLYVHRDNVAGAWPIQSSSSSSPSASTSSSSS